MAGEMITYTLADHSRELSKVGVRVGVVTAGTLPGLIDQIGDFREAMEAVTLGVVQREALTAFNNSIAATFPTDPAAQREFKWMVTYVDNTAHFDAPTNAIPNEGFGKKFQIELPTADVADEDLRLPNSDEADRTDQRWIDLIAAFQAMGRSPHGGVPLVIDIRLVGRNL